MVLSKSFYIEFPQKTKGGRKFSLHFLDKGTVIILACQEELLRRDDDAEFPKISVHIFGMM